jgi:hypothetical protein
MKLRFKGKKRQYELTGDDNQFVLSELTKARTGKKKGEISASPIGYYSQLEHVLNKIVHLEIVDSGSKTFEELLRAITDTKEYISTLLSENHKP